MWFVWLLLFLLVFVTTPARTSRDTVRDLIWICFYFALWGWVVIWFLATYVAVS